MSEFKVAICADKGLFERLAKGAKSATKALLKEAERYEHCGKEILYWPWTKWLETSPEVNHIMRNLPAAYDLIVIDEEGNIDEAIDGVGVLAAETIITWNGQDSDAEVANRKDFLRELKALGICGDLAKRVAEAAERVYV